MQDSVRLHPAFRRAVTLAPAIGRGRDGPCALGDGAVDRALAGGLAQGRLHEVLTAAAEDAAAATGFAAMLARRLVRPAGPLIWLREEAVDRRLALHAPGLAALGLDPGRLVLGAMPDALAVLRAAVEALRCNDVGLVVIEIWHQPAILDLTATRRLALAAERSGVTPLLLRIAARPMPSAAHTRWDVTPALSRPLIDDAPGHPALAARLARHCGGRAGMDWRMEWDRDTGSFRAAALSGAVPAPAGDRPAAVIRPGPWRRAG